MNEDENKIVVENLNAWYGDKQVLRDISFYIKKNRITVIMGPSGCGKSTLLRSINRLNDYIEGFRLEGKILVDGIDIYSDNIDIYELRRKIVMVLQKPAPFPMSIFDNVAFGPRIHGIKSKKKLMKIVRNALIKASLWDEVKDRLFTSAYELSGGQQQRLCIARALAVQPEVLLLDEPAAFLDPISTARLEEVIKEIKKEVTIVMVTHDIGQARRIADYIVFLFMGQLVEFGPASEIFTRPKKDLTERYLSGKIW
ncbi:MAG: phosphate ABC transporter ATP-binding protein PstB [Candidatus Njordarchaeota archaeon]